MLVAEWEKLQESEQIKELEISYYDFDTNVHFMIIDNRQLFWGFLYPKKEYPGSEVLASYIINSKSDEGENMLTDFDKQWNHIYDFARNTIN